MEKTNEITVKNDATKDAGRVKIGGGMMRFTDAPATKDSGRVKIGGGMLRF